MGLGGDCGPTVRGFDLVGEWVSASGSWMMYRRCLGDGDDESRWCY